MKMKNVADLYQLSPLQQGMLFHTLYAPRSGIYCEQIEMTLRASPDITALKEAWQQVIERHTILRTAFLWDGLQEPLQVVRQRVPLPWEELDLQGLAAAEQAERVRAFCQRDLLRDFDLSRAPLMRLTLLHFAADHHHLVWTHHHLLLDGWSVALLIEEVSLCYTALRQGQKPSLARPHPYRDYISWLQAQNLAEAERFWRRYLAGFSSSIPLVRDVAEEPKQVSPRSVPGSDVPISRPEGRECAEQELYLSREATDALRAFARRHQLTPGTLAQGAWALLLSRYSGETDIVFGTTVSTRPADLPGIETMIGLLINTLPARVHVAPDARLLPWLQQVQAEQAEARQYSYAPLIQIHEWSEVPRGQPLFESVLVVENYPTATAQQPDASIERRTGGETKWRIVQTNYPLMLAVVLSAQEQRLVLRVTYNQRRFSQEIILRLLGHLQTLLEGMLSQPEQTLATFPLLTAAERQQLLVEWNPQRALAQPQICLHELFEAQVKQTPDALALVYEQEHITYQKLNLRANQLASYLRLAGIALETPVGICFEQTHESIVAILGVLKAGGMYIPLDPASPLERLTSILHNAAAALVLTQASLLERLPSQIVPCCVLQSAWQQIALLSAENVTSGLHPANAAYLLYTSGSTGAPKGVIVEHRQLVSYAGAIAERVALQSPASFALLQPLAVDSCLTMLFPALLTGGTLHMISRDKALDAESLAESLSRSPVDYLKIAPSHLKTLLGSTPHQCLLPRLGLIIGGESSQWEWAQQLRGDLPEGGELYNHYGPTETTVGSLVFQEWTAEDRHLALTPLGRPLANTRVYVLDNHMQVVPSGIVGELYIAGAGLARGYFAQPDRTAERFLPDLFASEPGSRMYKTGDLVRYQSAGNLEFVGRNDEQVKIRGYRIEPGEIEAILLQHPAVREALVVAQEETPGEKRLVAYILPRDSRESEQALRAALRAHMNARLPVYMHPSRIIQREAFPLTAHGKVDRRALAATRIEAQPERETLFVAPRNSVEEALVQIWADVLHLQQVGVCDNFFEIGGHSLFATQIFSRVRECFQIRLPLRTLFEAPTIAALAEAIIQRTIEEADSDAIAQILAQQE